MHKSFFPLFLISLIGILASSRLQHIDGMMQWSGLIAGLAPLVFYHLALMRKRLLSPTEIDSVYYFGFLVTVITLVSTAISLGLSETTPNLRWILLQFGLGLVATGYALFARLHLLSKSTAIADTDVVDSTEKLAKSVQRVAGEFDKAGFHVAAFVEQTEKRLLEMEQRSATHFASVQAKFEQRMVDAEMAFNEALANSAELSFDRAASIIDKATDKFSDAISSVMEEVIRIQSEAEAISFAKAAERIAGFSAEIESSISTITSKVIEAGTESAASISELTATSRKVIKLASDIATKLQTLESVSALVQSISSASGAIGSMSKTAADADASLSSLAEKAAHAEGALRQSVTEPLSASALGSALASAEKSITEAGRTAGEALSTMGTAVAPVAGKVAELLDQIKFATSSASVIERGASDMTRSVTALEDSISKTTSELLRAASVAETAGSFQADMTTATSRLSGAVSGLEVEASAMASMLSRASEGLEKAFSTASAGLISVEARLTPIDDLASTARAASQKIKTASIANNAPLGFATAPQPELVTEVVAR